MANTTLGTLLIELKAKTDQFEKGMKNAKDLSFSTTGDIVTSLSRIGSQLMNMRFNGVAQAGKSVAMLGGIAVGTGAALATSLITVAVKTSEKMIEMSHNAEKAGMDIKEFSENAYAAKRSGVAIEEFTNAMAKLNKTALSAAQGNAQAQRALALAGTSATDSAGRLRSTGAILDDIIKKYDSLSDKTLKSGLSQQVFGRGGAAVIPFLEKGGDAIRKYREQAERLGVALDEKTVLAAKNFKGAINDYKAASEGATIQLTAGMLPAINQIIDSMTKVTGKASAMREFGETVGEAFKGIAAMVYRAAYAFEFWKIKFDQFKAPKLDQSTKNITSATMGLSNPASAAAALQSSGLLAPQVLSAEEQKHFYDTKTTDPFQERLDEANRKLQERLDNLNAPPSVKNPAEKTRVGANVTDPDAKNFVADEIAKLKEKASANSALAAAQLVSEQSVRATTAANQADAIILQIATKASKEHKSALDQEIASAQQKYGADVLALTTLSETAQRNNEFNKSIAEQIRDADIATDAHRRLADAYSLGSESVQSATTFNEIDQMVRKADLKLTKDQLEALDRLREAKLRNAESSADEALARRTSELQGAARATQLLTAVIGKDTDAEIDARAQIEAENFAIQNNIALTDSRIAKMKEQIAANERAARAQQTGQGMVADYDPQATYRKRVADIDAAVLANKDLTVFAEAAKRDAYEQEQQAIDELAMKTQRGAAGAAVALRQWLRDAKNWSVQFHGAVTDVLQGFDTGFRNAFHDIIMQTKSVGQAFLEMGQTMVGSVVDALGRIIAKWIETKIILATMKLFGINVEEDDPMAKAQKQIQANAAEAQSYAGLAASEEFAYALAESMGNVPYAFGMSMLALGIGEGYAAISAFDNGGIMPKTGMALVHQDEGVLTAPVTKMLKSMATSPKFNSSQAVRQNQGARGGDVHLTYAPNVSAVDERGVRELLNQQADHLREIVRSGMRNKGMEAYG